MAVQQAVRRPSTPRLLLILLLAYLIARASLGTLLNPPLNGPDEAGHVEYVRTLAESGGRQVTGVEANQPPLYYAIAAALWKLATPLSTEARLALVRQLSVAAGATSLLLTWHAARRLWPAQPLLAMAAAMLAALAPGHLYLLASISNDPLAEALAGLVVLLALMLAAPAGAVSRPVPPVGQQGDLRCHQQSEGAGSGAPDGDREAGATDAMRDRRYWLWLAWAGAAAAAMATKYTTAPVLAATAAALAWHYRHHWSRRRWARAGLVAAGLAALALYGRLLLQPPTASFAAAAAHFGPQALIRAPFAYVRLGGLAESFRSFWYAYDFAVRWPRSLELALAVPTAAALAMASAALIAEARSRAADCPSPPAPLPPRGEGSARLSLTIPLPQEGKENEGPSPPAPLPPGERGARTAAPPAERRATQRLGGALVLWLAAGAQIAFVVSRFGFGDLLHVEMGGAAQAKAFFPALLPLALLTTDGLATTWRWRGLDPRWGTLLLLGWLVLLDATSAALTLWHHYRWLQVGVAAW